jgi:beta-galactosidase
VALLFAYEDLWAAELQPHAGGWSYRAPQLAFHGALRALGVNVAVTHPDRGLTAHPPALAPPLHPMDEACA